MPEREAGSICSPNNARKQPHFTKHPFAFEGLGSRSPWPLALLTVAMVASGPGGGVILLSPLGLRASLGTRAPMSCG
jgi:hypothetical protein